MADSVNDALFVRGVLIFMALTMEGKCTAVHEDNERSISLANNPLSLARLRHTDLIFHSSRESVSKGEIAVVYITTVEQHADGMTKTLVRKTF